MRTISIRMGAAFGAALILFTACLNDSGMKPLRRDGAIKVSVTVENIGSLHKAAAIELKQLVIKLHRRGQDTIFDTLPLSGRHTQTHSLEYVRLATNVSWSLSAHTVDTEGATIHSGLATFTIPPGRTENVALSLNARYSMLQAHFYPIRDSVTRLEMRVDSILVDSTSFAKQSRLNDTVTLSYDYLPATQMGTSHAVRLEAHGTMWGFDTLLYRGDTVVKAFSGLNSTYNIILHWVGPSLPPPGQAKLTVILGAVAGTTVNARLEDTTETR